MSRFQDDAPPWSFFLPVTLAVVVGILAADAIRYAISTVFADPTPAQEHTPRQAPPEPAPVPAAPAETATPAAEDDATAAAPARTEAPASAEPSPPSAETAAADPAAQPELPGGIRTLPGPLNARQDGAQAACINGTVVQRSGNGWEQELENDAPVRCTASSP